MKNPRFFQFKKALVNFFVFWIISAILVVRLGATFKLTSAVPVINQLSPNSYSCEAKLDSEIAQNPEYINPDDSVVDAYEKSKIGNNLINNSSLEKLNTAGLPENYESNRSAYPSIKSLWTEKNGFRFLRAEQKLSGKNNQTAWIPEFFAVSDKPYFFSFEYRASVESAVDIEFLRPDSSTLTRGLYIIKPQIDWTIVRGHFDNYDGEFSKARIIVTTTDTGYVDLSQPQVYELGHSLSQPMISIAFDDGWESFYESARPLFAQHNIPTTQFIIANFAQQKEKGHMDFAQIKTLQSEGHEIASHSLEHCDQIELNPKQLDSDTLKSEKIFYNASFEQRRGFAYPYGRYNQTTQNHNKNYYAYIRSSDEGFNDYYFDISNIKTMSVEANTSVQTLNDWVQYAKKHNLWLVLLYHKIDGNGEYNNSKQDLEKHLEIIKNSDVKTYTISDALKVLGR